MGSFPVAQQYKSQNRGEEKGDPVSLSTNFSKIEMNKEEDLANKHLRSTQNDELFILFNSQQPMKEQKKQTVKAQQPLQTASSTTLPGCEVERVTGLRRGTDNCR